MTVLYGNFNAASFLLPPQTYKSYAHFGEQNTEKRGSHVITMETQIGKYNFTH